MKKAIAIGNTLTIYVQAGSCIQGRVTDFREKNKPSIYGMQISFLGAPQLANELASLINQVYPEEETK